MTKPCCRPDEPVAKPYVLFLVSVFQQNETDYYNGIFFSFFRQITKCMRSGHFFHRTTKLLDRQAETHLS